MKNKSLMSSRLCLPLLVGAVFFVSGNLALAGEVDGKGNPVPGGANGKSECSYSGQQDDPAEDEGFFRGDRVQTWGQIPKSMRDFLRTIGLHPGQACNPKKSGN